MALTQDIFGLCCEAQSTNFAGSKLNAQSAARRANYMDVICNLLNRAPQQDCHVAVAPRYDAIPLALCLSKCHSLRHFFLKPDPVIVAN